MGMLLQHGAERTEVDSELEALCDFKLILVPREHLAPYLCRVMRLCFTVSLCSCSVSVLTSTWCSVFRYGSWTGALMSLLGLWQKG